MIEYKIYELFHAANKKRLHQKEILLRQSQEDIEYLRNIFSVLLPERFVLAGLPIGDTSAGSALSRVPSGYGPFA